MILREFGIDKGILIMGIIYLAKTNDRVIREVIQKIQDNHNSLEKKFIEAMVAFGKQNQDIRDEIKSAQSELDKLGDKIDGLEGEVKDMKNEIRK